MAQALFDEHPLEEYLRRAGEAQQFIPGSSAEFELELDPMSFTDFDDDDLEGVEWRPILLIRAIEAVHSILSVAYFPGHQSPFVERFKYNVISSSLLAVSLPSTHGRLPRSSLPGHLDHSRSSSSQTEYHPALPDVASTSPYLIPSLALALVLATFGIGYNYLLVGLLLATPVITQVKSSNEIPKPDMSSSLDTLNDLIVSSNEWESVVQEAIGILENDERSAFSEPTSPSSPSSSIRVALQSSLHTTQIHCDHVRHLFSALTSPTELSQLSEMYAPPSPTFSSHDTSPRPLSLPASRNHTSSMPFHSIVQESKRATWNGSYTHSHHPGRPTTPVFRRGDKRRSDLSAVLQAVDPPLRKAASAPTTPSPASPRTVLPRVHEDASNEHDASDSYATPETQYFGAAALALHRKRKSAGMEAFKPPPPSYISSITPVVHSPRMSAASTLSSGSRFTPIHTTRHPLSFSALHHALQGALAAKRYVCSHLLALRFADEEDEGYWEDVKSVMGLLTSTFVDTSTRLAEVLEEAERQNLRDQNPTPVLDEDIMTSVSDGEDNITDKSNKMAGNNRRGLEEPISLAPVPSHISRFVAHIDAIKTAMDDARSHLEQCITSLREEGSPTVTLKARRNSTSPTHDTSAKAESNALQSYDCLRRELGLALRECERGRARLVDVVCPPNLHRDLYEGESDDLPAFGHDGSDGSDKPDSGSPFDDERITDQSHGVAVVSFYGVEGGLDDATSHLLLTASSQHLPPPGVEQVFETNSGDGVSFTRQRSQLTRQERITLMKKSRQSDGAGLGLGIDVPSHSEQSKVEKWGPGGEVVQELKDVIWKVGERRRKMADGQIHNVVPNE